MINKIEIKQLRHLEEASLLEQEFAKHNMYREDNYYGKCLRENEEGKRVTLIAYYDGKVAGCCHLLYESKYHYFQHEKIPEINDLCVFPKYRRKNIASLLFDELESKAATTSKTIGLGVGLYKDYGPAQLMYGKRGYVLDGKGAVSNNQTIEPGKTVMVDDELLIYLVKSLQ
ncbi:GNAT family N-acetyltransferase [Bacillus horti]|uniref:GNAT superfamily N-acetyltransferase n=1 Tax=Caldalkalibacillus horti TaxID=77523 RepID=A0ABT9W2U0_9BACI|nr:GNAT family N-acetyltransferase [Bacillus horti]MDQ0167435.1 GNAT superfamily N-acetyltransferase [Bacillus horti]